MDPVISADGTRIATYASGEGRPLVIVNGAMSTAADAAPVAAALAAHGFRAIAYDRRARGNSTDAVPYGPEREVEDLAAVIDSAGSPAVVLGHSSGAVLTLLAAAEGVAMDHAVLSEPPFRYAEPAPEGLVDELQELVDAGRTEDAIILFQRRGVGLPDEMIEQIRQAPFFRTLPPLAQSTVYDATLTRDYALPTDAMLTVGVPVTILRGMQTFPVLIESADTLAKAMPQAQLIVSDELRDHRLDPEVTARLLTQVLTD